jgi:hypothetical protein
MDDFIEHASGAGIVVASPGAGALAPLLALSAGDSTTVALTDDGVLSSVLGMAGYLTAVALMGLGLGTLLRSVASSIGVLLGGVMVLPTIAGALLPASLDSAYWRSRMKSWCGDSNALSWSRRWPGDRRRRAW